MKTKIICCSFFPSIVKFVRFGVLQHSLTLPLLYQTDSNKTIFYEYIIIYTLDIKCNNKTSTITWHRYN